MGQTDQLVECENQFDFYGVPYGSLPLLLADVAGSFLCSISSVYCPFSRLIDHKVLPNRQDNARTQPYQCLETAPLTNNNKNSH